MEGRVRCIGCKRHCTSHTWSRQLVQSRLSHMVLSVGGSHISRLADIGLLLVQKSQPSISRRPAKVQHWAATMPPCSGHDHYQMGLKQLLNPAHTAAACRLLCPPPSQQTIAHNVSKQSQIHKVRDRVTQLEQMGVPEDALDGHAFHTYTLTSPDQSVQFVFKHNVTGRSIYADGTLDAVLFLAQKRREGAAQKVYSMSDVVRHGRLR